MKAEIPKPEVEYYNETFLITQYNYNLQFYPYYNARLNAMKESLVNSAKHTWPEIPIHDLSDLADKDDEDEESGNVDNQMSLLDEEIFHGKEVVVIGILFKKMPSQPNILKELDDEKKMIAQIEIDQFNFVSEHDIIYLQSGDESIELKGNIKINELCTGICIAVKGHITPSTSGFIVDDVCFSLINQIERPFITNDYHVAIVSGLGFSKNMAKNLPLARSLNLLFDILTGNSKLVVSKTIVSLIIAGNSLGKNARNEEKESDLDKKTPAWNKKVQSFTVDAMKLLDKFLANIGQYTFVDVMPGVLDPCNYLWPQQPMHPCLLPNAYSKDSIRSVPNPHRASYFGVEFLGTSGQNVDSIRSCTNFTESTDILRQIMEWGHIAPTCPDLLHSYPYSDKDPLVLDHYPDIFFAGNQSDFALGSFESQSGKKVKLISVPVFEDKMIAILVNLRTLNCEIVAFN